MAIEDAAKEDAANEDAANEEIRSYKIEVPQAALDDLQARLANTRWPEAETVDDWSQGIPLSYTRELAEYWANDYDWRKLETRLNTYDQGMTNIDGVDIHFLHVRSPNPDAYPVVMTHGWPGSIIEFLKVIDPLTNPEAHGGTASQALHLVIPTMPGYGFSGKPTGTGWGVQKIGAAWDVLMGRLGYTSYGAQGGDWGAIVTTMIGLHHADNCEGIHLNMPIAPPDPELMEDMTDLEHRALAAMTHYDQWDSGYSKQQGTRPQTIGYGLVDSPVGQMAWIVEKFWSWMDCDDHPENVLTKEEMLNNVMMYWLTASGASSARLYWESFNNVDLSPVPVPAGLAVFPHEIFQTSRRWAEKRFNVQQFNTFEKGGHFAAFEQPDAFTNDVRTFFESLT